MSELRESIRLLLGQGVTQRRIAHELGVAPTTVAYHVRRLREPPREPKAAPDAPPTPAVSYVRTREAVAALLAQGLSKLDIARRLGVSRATVSYHCRRLGEPVDERGARRYDWDAIQRYYDLGHTVDQCQAAFGFSKQTWHAAKRRGALVTRPRALPIEELCVKSPRGRHNLRLRLLAAGLKLERCEECGLEEWQGSAVPLALHHVNGDRHDNRLENLQLLCHNCHALTDTYAGRRRLETGRSAVAARRADQPRRGCPDRMSSRASSRSPGRPHASAASTRPASSR